MITVTVDYIDGTDITNDIRAIDPKMIAPGSIRPSTANNANSACIMEVLTWDGNIQNYRAVRWKLTDTYASVRDSLGLTSVTLVEVNGAVVTTDIRAIDESMMVAGSMKPKTANNTGTAAIFSVQKWDNNLPGYVSETWEISATYAALKTALDALNNPSFGTASGTDTYAVTLSPAITVLETGVPFYVKFTNPNTGAATLNVNGLGAKDLKKEASTALVASDIIADKVYTLVYDGTNIQIDIQAPVAEWTTTTVAISSAQILAMGTTPIELLPSPGAGKYYEYIIRLEETLVTTQYTLADPIMVGGSSSYTGSFINPTFLTGGGAQKVVILHSQSPQETENGMAMPEILRNNTLELNESIVLTTWNAVDPTLGDGTINAIISYKTHTFIV